MGPDPPGDTVANPERPLRLLLAASFVLPIAVFAIAAWISYRQHVDDSVDRLQRSLGHVYEHATKVFETFDLTARYVDELIGGAPNEGVAMAESYYHAQLKTLTDALPQLRDVWLVDEYGHPIVSGTIFPMDRSVDLSDRPFFQWHKSNPNSGPYLSKVIKSRAVDRRLFLISRRRLLRGSDEFLGIVTTAVAPEYFTQYYARLPGARDDVVGLLRQDGSILAYYPSDGAGGRLPQKSPLLAAIRQSSQGMVTDVASDGSKRITVFRKLPRHGVYVFVGIPTATVVAQWTAAMSYHLVFVIPAMVALVLLSWVALRYTRRESLAYARLRQEVARRETTERALRQAQKMEAIGRLTGGIAHDFNNLLTAIIGNVDLANMRLKGREEPIVRLLAAAKEASQRAAILVQRLLAFSRQHPQEVEVLDVDRLVEDMSDLLRRTIGEIITIETGLARDLWAVSVDRNQLENAILNLAVNARDAMPDGGCLRIETANAHVMSDFGDGEGERVAPGEYVLVSVSDTGAGMTKDVREQAFEPFFTTKPKGIGTGLGLSMVYGFVKQSGGHIKIDSEVGRGTVVRMYLPRVMQTAMAGERSVAAAADRDGTYRSRNRETILLVEDDEPVNRFGCEALQELGYRVLPAATATDALALLTKHPEIRLLFTDIVLPGGVNGRTLAEAVVRLRPDVGVLFATGYTRDAIVFQGRLDPSVEVLMKPYTYQALAKKIRDMLDRSAAAAAPLDRAGA
jgi:two-component system NtrC family sensor kinase